VTATLGPAARAGRRAAIILSGLAGIALAGPAWAAPAAKAKPAATASKPKKAEAKAKAPARPAPTPVQFTGTPSEGAIRLSRWIAASGDNRALPYAIVDKPTASLALFNGKGELLEQVPVLLGIAAGDEATPGIAKKKFAEIGPAEKTTPAGRYLARYGKAWGRQRVLWVDYATSVAIHPIPGDVSKSEQRRERMLSPEPDDNRITFGCINVPSVFYTQRVRTMFGKKGGYVYVVPDVKPVETVFPGVHTVPPLTVAAAG